MSKKFFPALLLALAIAWNGWSQEIAQLPQYGEGLKRLFPEYAKIVKNEARGYVVQNAEGAELGRLLVEYAREGEKARGFNGPIELALAFKDGKAIGVLIGANDETPRFLLRVTEGALPDAWNGATLEEIATREIKPVTGATYSSKAIIADVRRLALDHLKYHGQEPPPAPAASAEQCQEGGCENDGPKAMDGCEHGGKKSMGGCEHGGMKSGGCEHGGKQAMGGCEHGGKKSMGGCDHGGKKSMGGCEHGGMKSGGCDHGGKKSMGGCEHGGKQVMGGCEHGGKQAMGGCEHGGMKSGGCEHGGMKSGGCEHGGKQAMGGCEHGGKKAMGGCEHGGMESGGCEHGGKQAMGGCEHGGKQSEAAEASQPEATTPEAPLPQEIPAE